MEEEEEDDDALLPMTTDESSDVLLKAVCEYTTTTTTQRDDDFGTTTVPVGVFRLEMEYTRWELKTATALAAGRIREAIEEEQKMMGKKRGENFGGESGRYHRDNNRCAIFMDQSSGACFVTLVLALIHIEVEFACVRLETERNATTGEKMRRFVRDDAKCSFGVCLERDREYVEKYAGGASRSACSSSFVVLTETWTLREPLDAAKKLISSSDWNVARTEKRSTTTTTTTTTTTENNNKGGDARTAYVCFTSGTTGRPKGVKTTRENIVAYARAKVKNERLDENSIVALVSAHVFDPCIGDLVSAVLAKSTLATFSPRDALMRGNTLKHALAASQATHVCCTPSFWEFGGMLLDANYDGLNLKSVALGGEKIPKKISDSFRGNEITLLNVYGVTEATVYQMSKRIEEEEEEEEEERMRHKGATNIGTPLDESFASLVIVENDNEVAEDNEVGEIAIYGRGVPPEGYLNGENGNARNAFRDVHFRNKNIKRRCYATGDLGYFDSKTKEYYLLGRIESDRQVKIRGHRIELEGVESILRERCESVLIPNVIESSILCFLDERSSDNNDDDAGKEIVAFLKLVEEEDEEYREEENRRARRMDVLLAVDLNCAPWLLSNGSMPRKFVFLEKDEDLTIPLSTTGKRDFHAFYDRHRDKERFSVLASDEADDAKKDQLETLVAKCWADALSCGVDFEKIKKNDSFVRLGGNSMSALIACRKLREALNASSLRDDGNDQNEDENEPGVKNSEAGALLAPENVDDDVDVDGTKSIERLCGAFLGIDGEGPLAPCELLRHSVLASYCAFLRANGTELCVSASSKKQGENKVDVDDEIHPDVLAAKAAVYRACARATDASLVYALVAPFVSHAELLREILGNGRKTNDIADENLTALHVLASRANLNEERLSEENVLPLVKLLVLEYKATPLAQTRSGKTMPIHIAAARGCPKILKIFYGALEEDEKELFFMKDVDEQTCLHLASRSGNSEAVRAVLDLIIAGDDADNDNKSSNSTAMIVNATDAWNRTARDWAFLLGFRDTLAAFSSFSFSTSSRKESDLLHLPVEQDLISLSLSSDATSSKLSSNRKMDVSGEYLATLLKHLKKDASSTIDNRIRAASGLRDVLCANARNRHTAHKQNVAKALTEALVSLVSKEEEEEEEEERKRYETLLLHVIFAIRNAAGYGASRKQFLSDEVDVLRALASVVDLRKTRGRTKEHEEDNISWQALSAMIVLCRAKETKEGLLASMEMLKELGYGDICRPVFERTEAKLNAR